MKRIIFIILAFILIGQGIAFAAWGPLGRTFRSMDRPSDQQGRAPTVTDDAQDGYRVGDIWIDETNGKPYLLLDDTIGSASWEGIGAESGASDFNVTGTFAVLDPSGVSLIQIGGGSGDTLFVENLNTPTFTSDANSSRGPGNIVFWNTNDLSMTPSGETVYQLVGTSGVSLRVVTMSQPSDTTPITTQLSGTGAGVIGARVLDGSGASVWAVMQDKTEIHYGKQVHNSASVYSNSFVNFTTAVSQYWNGSIAGDNMTVTKLTIYIDTTSGVTDNTTYRIAFHSKDDMDGSNEIAAFTTNLAVSGVSTVNYGDGQVNISGVTVPLFNSSGIVKYDKLSIGNDGTGTSEFQQVTASVGDIDTGMSGVTVTPLHAAYAHDRAVAGVYEMTEMFMTRDEDSTQEIHVSIEPLAAPGAGVTVFLKVEVQ